jgi:hypothetical protein
MPNLDHDRLVAFLNRRYDGSWSFRYQGDVLQYSTFGGGDYWSSLTPADEETYRDDMELDERRRARAAQETPF